MSDLEYFSPRYFCQIFHTERYEALKKVETMSGGMENSTFNPEDYGAAR